MRAKQNGERRRGLGPFSGGQLTIIIVAICAMFALPTAALAAAGVFTTNSATAAAVKATNSNANGIGVSGTGKKFGVYSNGPLGVAGKNPLVCTGCVTGTDIANRTVVKYNLAAGASSAPVTIPANVPVQVVGVQTNSGYRGVGFVAMLRVPNQFLEWTGLESTSPSGITEGFASAPGTHILFIDYGHLVDVQVHDANSLVIHNANTVPMTGTVTITW
jgi:hypothetical protein